MGLLHTLVDKSPVVMLVLQHMKLQKAVAPAATTVVPKILSPAATAPKLSPPVNGAPATPTIIEIVPAIAPPIAPSITGTFEVLCSNFSNDTSVPNITFCIILTIPSPIAKTKSFIGSNNTPPIPPDTAPKLIPGFIKLNNITITKIVAILLLNSC